MTILGKYELHEQLGRGGFGTVYRAVDTTLQREVALKVLHPQLTTDPDFLERFQREARLVASLKSLHIVTIHDLDEKDGRVFIAMEYLPGGSLKDRLEREGALTFEDTVRILKEICAGLSIAHKKGLVHRDIKPGNILFDEDGKAVIGDFGLARAVQLSGSSASTSSGVGAGTPAYRAPELWRGKPPASPATDVYSLGCVLYEMLTGKVLFDGSTPDEILTQHILEGPALPDRFPTGIPESVRAVLEKALAKDQERRYKEESAFMIGLDQCGRESAVSKPREERVEKGACQPTPVTDSPSTHKDLENRNWKEIGIVAGVVAALGLGIWIGGQYPKTLSFLASSPTIAFISQPTITSIPESKATLTMATSPEPTIDVNLGIGSSRVSEIDGMEMMYVPAGEFLMGSPNGVGESDEHPQHKVNLDAFWIDKTEVTNGMFAKCVAVSACLEPSDNSSYSRDSYFDNPDYANYPVVYVNWNQARAYCTWAGRVLPTEAQWEKAARGTDGRTYPWGSQNSDMNRSNFNNNVGDTTIVGSFPAGASWSGAMDMAGNVWEWTSDIYNEGYYLKSPHTNPQNAGIGNTRVFRGGSWLNPAIIIRSTYRRSFSPSDSVVTGGFRCALPLS